MKKESIANLKTMLQSQNMTNEQIKELKQDERLGVKKLIKQYENKLEKERIKRQTYRTMKEFDKKFLHHDMKWIAGVDEAGRGPLAGPVVAAAVILPKDVDFNGLTDSKQLTELERNMYYEQIKKNAIAYHIEIISAEEIDRLNILEATKLAMTNALLQLEKYPDIALIDAVQLTDLPFQQAAIIKGDDKSLSIAAASVLAKVTRDKWMEKYDELYPQYGFKKHKGYGTKEHMDAMKRYGVCPIHRTSFRPVQLCMK
ncbi:ribonuclease HII [Pseudogracilibacillus sp. SO10305]